MFAKSVLTQVEISRDEARLLVVEARYYPASDTIPNHLPAEIVAYERIGGMLHRAFRLSEIPDVDLTDGAALLRYARDNMPDNVRFGPFSLH